MIDKNKMEFGVPQILTFISQKNLKSPSIYSAYLHTPKAFGLLILAYMAHFDKILCLRQLCQKSLAICDRPFSTKSILA